MHALLALLSGWGAPFVSAPASVGTGRGDGPLTTTWLMVAPGPRPSLPLPLPPPLPSEEIVNRCQHQGTCLCPWKGLAPLSGISQILQCFSFSLILTAIPSSRWDWLMTPVLLVRRPRSESLPGLPGPRGAAGIACGFGPKSRALAHRVCYARALTPAPGPASVSQCLTCSAGARWPQSDLMRPRGSFTM